MNTSIMPANIFTQIAKAKQPQEAMELEIMSNVAIAFAQETDNKDMLKLAWEAYIASSRKTTELIRPFVVQGRPEKGSPRATFLSDYGITKSQWHRRVQLLEVPAPVIQRYFDDVVAVDFAPSMASLMRFAGEKTNGGEIDAFVRDCNIIAAVAKRLLTANDSRMTPKFRKWLEAKPVPAQGEGEIQAEEYI